MKTADILVVVVIGIVVLFAVGAYMEQQAQIAAAKAAQIAAAKAAREIAIACWLWC